MQIEECLILCKISELPKSYQGLLSPEPSGERLNVSAQTEIEISITVNGQIVRTRSATLDDLLRERGLETQKVATAVNGDFVPKHARAETRLAPEDRIEVVSARQGG